MSNNSQTDKINEQLSTKIYGNNPEPPLTFEDDIMPMINACVTPQHEAILRLLFDSAIRSSELAALDIGDVVTNDNGMSIVVNGKQGTRVIPLFHISIPIIKVWLDEHPLKGDESAPLFGTKNSNGFDFRRLEGRTLTTIIKTLCKRAGIDKQITPHQIRHSRLTQLAIQRDVSEETLRIFSGWEKNITMSKIYVHMNSNDVKKKILREYGLITETP